MGENPKVMHDETNHHGVHTEDENRAMNTPADKWRWLNFHYAFITCAYFFLFVLYLNFIKYIPAFSKGQYLVSTDRSRHLLRGFPSIRSTDAIEYEFRTWPVEIAGNPFAGKPSLELDSAWHELLDNINIRVTTEDLKFYNVSSLPLVGETRNGEQQNTTWVGQLGVFHELHCLKRVRHWLYRDDYFKHAPEAVLIEEAAHVDHCIEVLRQSIMCHADLTLSGLRWVFVDNTSQLTVDAPGYHTCVNWDRLRAWNDDRAVNVFMPGVLATPEE